MIIFSILISLSAAQTVTWQGKCAEVPLIADFDVPKYQEKFNSDFLEIIEIVLNRYLLCKSE